MIYILIALPGEFPPEYQEQLDTSRYRLMFTGVGKINASVAAVIAAADKECAGIINYGTAGCLNPELAGKLHSIGTVRQRDMDARPQAELGQTPFDTSGYAGDIQLLDKPVVLSTGDNFVQSPPELESDLVDMEGYAITKIACQFGRTVRLYKYASDMADEDAAKTWEENQADGAQAFIDLIKVIDEYGL